jgi:hypothetical protein
MNERQRDLFLGLWSRPGDRSPATAVGVAAPAIAGCIVALMAMASMGALCSGAAP